MIGKDVSAGNFITVITGLPRSGKSTLLKKKIIPSYLEKNKRVLVVDVNKEYTPTKNLFVFRFKDYSAAETELNQLAAWLIQNNKDKKFDVIILDESNVMLNKYTLQRDMLRLVNTLRHVKIDLVAVARRPVEVNVTISEYAQKRYIFHTSGYNDIQRLNSYMKGLGDMAEKLGEHDYLVIDNDRKITKIEAA